MKPIGLLFPSVTSRIWGMKKPWKRLLTDFLKSTGKVIAARRSAFVCSVEFTNHSIEPVSHDHIESAIRAGADLSRHASAIVHFFQLEERLFLLI